MWHVEDLAVETKHTKIQLILDNVIPLFQQYLILSTELSMDETMMVIRDKVAS